MIGRSGNSDTLAPSSQTRPCHVAHRLILLAVCASLIVPAPRPRQPRAAMSVDGDRAAPRHAGQPSRRPPAGRRVAHHLWRALHLFQSTRPGGGGARPTIAGAYHICACRTVVHQELAHSTHYTRFRNPKIPHLTAWLGRDGQPAKSPSASASLSPAFHTDIRRLLWHTSGST